jgi:hypothetical protein
MFLPFNPVEALPSPQNPIHVGTTTVCALSGLEQSEALALCFVSASSGDSCRRSALRSGSTAPPTLLAVLCSKRSIPLLLQL